MGKQPKAPWPAGAWKKHLSEAVTEVDELLQLLDLEVLPPSATPAAVRGFPLRVPRGFMARMRRGDRHDPLLLQVLPIAAEDDRLQGYSVDPLGELETPPMDGLLHKYRGRALVVVTGACAVHCRYCFRRHFPYEEHDTASRGITAALERIALDPEISEVILSGGDPLMVSESRLAEVSRGLQSVAGVRRLRIHTRLPVVLPQRVDGPLISWIQSLSLPLIIVIHANHAREIDDDVRRALAALRETDATLLNQSVLLAGVNDNVDALVDLSEALFGAGVLPYYLHMLDPVQGAAHFEVPEETAKRLHQELTASLPGYLVPRLVREVPGAPAKVGVDLWA
jgi:EF-P beta-lysylation protein EpmB